MNVKKRHWIMIASSILGISLLSYYVFGQESRYAKKYANELFDYPLPAETVVLEQGYNYGTFFGGGPWGSDGLPTVAAYLKVKTELSERDIVEYYDKRFEIYFDGDEHLKVTAPDLPGTSKNWYEGQNARFIDMNQLSDEVNSMTYIVQLRKNLPILFL
ncbi:hypothetical protein MKY91_17080 [Alkalicoccobacillus gibsonii]|uniref:Uncharacterized protein n=1 Tax=Alkalicoccobacillus gibsonii TaxID=79881 RepID=A0ABU9VLT2_9BACI